jgi:hypothetical protein
MSAIEYSPTRKSCPSSRFSDSSFLHAAIHRVRDFFERVAIEMLRPAEHRTKPAHLDDDGLAVWIRSDRVGDLTVPFHAQRGPLDSTRFFHLAH